LLKAMIDNRALNFLDCHWFSVDSQDTSTLDRESRELCGMFRIYESEVSHSTFIIVVIIVHLSTCKLRKYLFIKEGYAGLDSFSYFITFYTVRPFLILHFSV